MKITIIVPSRLPRHVVFVGALGFALLGSMAVSWAGVPNVFNDGDVLTAKALNDNFAAAGDPSGTVVAFGGDATKLPAGWLLCDGASVQRSMFPALFAAIGTTWGSVDSQTFNVPDLRGRFLRGVSGTTLNDPDCASRTGPAGTGCSFVGTLEADSLQPHTHVTSILGEGSGAPSSLGSTLTTTNTNGATVNYTSAATGGSETRPRNIAVLYMIKQ